MQGRSGYAWRCEGWERDVVSGSDSVKGDGCRGDVGVPGGLKDGGRGAKNGSGVW